LLNTSSNAVPLYDPAAVTNTWKITGGVNFVFPQNVTLPAGGYLLVVNFDPVVNTATLAEFRSRYGLSNSVPLYGPYGGHLANSGETVALYKPDPPQLPPHPDAGFVPYIRVEQIDYLNVVPWPTTANSNGFSIQRRFVALYGNEPTNWLAAAPTAAASNGGNPYDSNNDGLPDSWQLQYFSSVNDPQAAPNADPDGDGFTNLQEYVAGTDPTDPASYLKIDSATTAGGIASIHFTAVAGKTYTVLYRTNLLTGTWLKLADVPAQGSTGPVTVNDPAFSGSNSRYYRLTTPSLP
jgi:hypothetical protein